MPLKVIVDYISNYLDSEVELLQGSKEPVPSINCTVISNSCMLDGVPYGDDLKEVLKDLVERGLQHYLVILGNVVAVRKN